MHLSLIPEGVVHRATGSGRDVCFAVPEISDYVLTVAVGEIGLSFLNTLNALSIRTLY